ncbi:MAG: ArsA family ATPase [Kofleriaceae bacterium]
MKELLERHRLVVCVGTGGVGKTTISAALALGAARAGRRAMVLTIDPARALGRALGVDLANGAEVAPNLHAAMLDQKRAWDAFVARHAPSDAVARTLLDNPFYRRLSTAFAGSSEYMAIEEMCRLVESGAHDLVVLDTPPSVHAIDFLRAPERIDRLLDQPRDITGSLARFVARQLERAAGSTTLGDIGRFLGAMTALVDGVRERTRRARGLLRDREAAFVLVTGARASILEDTRELAIALEARAAPLAAVVINRTHPILPARSVAGLDPWLAARWNEAFAEAVAEDAILSPFVASLPPAVTCARVPDGRDVCSLSSLEEIADHLGL